MPLGDLAGDAIVGVFRVLGRILVEVFFELLIKGTGIPLALWGWHAAGCAAALWAGWWIFQRTRKGFADVI